MIGTRQTFCFKVISVILIFFFIIQMKVLPVTGEELEYQLRKAKSEYIDKKYKDARERLERLAAVYEGIKEQTAKMKKRYGWINLILGACCERTGNSFKAERYYKNGLFFLPESISILELEKESLPIYRKISGIYRKKKK